MASFPKLNNLNQLWYKQKSPREEAIWPKGVSFNYLY